MNDEHLLKLARATRVEAVIRETKRMRLSDTVSESALDRVIRLTAGE
jgi:hypothetical protein